MRGKGFYLFFGCLILPQPFAADAGLTLFLQISQAHTQRVWVQPLMK